MRKFFILLLVSLFSLASPVHAEVDFSNKTITWVVPFKEGGGTSRFARFIQPFLTKYERARLIGIRAQQLSSGASAMIDTTNCKNTTEVAEEELKQRVIPLIIRRYLSNGKYEDWKIDEFKII